MSAQVIAAGAEIAAVIVAAGAIIVAVRSVRDQLWLHTFSEYTRRYADIVNDLPTAARQPNSGFEFSTADHETQETLLRALRAYLNLCSEEFYLHSRRKIDDDTWGIWREGIEETMRLPWLRTTWQTMRQEYSYFEPFCAFVDDCVADKAPPPAPAVGLTMPGN
jgi:hypothetical protein